MAKTGKRAPAAARPWAWTTALAAGTMLAALAPRPAAVLMFPLFAALALAGWIECRRAARLALETAGLKNLLAPYVPALPGLVALLEEAASQMECAVLEACDGFDGIGARARAAAGAGGQDLEREILRVVVALQFQDIVNQRITHAIETLKELGEDLAACLGEMPPGGKPGVERAPALERASAFEAKRRALSGHRLPAKGRAQKDSNDNDIEIFSPEVGP